MGLKPAAKKVGKYTLNMAKNAKLIKFTQNTGKYVHKQIYSVPKIQYARRCFPF
jgi:hypothetical protein